MQPDTGAAAGELVGQIQDRARELGLTWQIVKGTVITDGSDPTNVPVVIDGDSQPIGAISTVGPILADARVWVLVVPPGGNYITGLVAPDSIWPIYSARLIASATSASLTISNIPIGLRRLRISYRARADNAVNAQTLLMRVNSNLTASYFFEYGQANNAAIVGVSGSAATSGVIGICTGASASAGVYASGQVEIQGWDRAASNTNLNWTFVSQGLGNGVANFFAQYGGGLFFVDGPYTSIQFLPAAGSFITGTEFQLEGWPT